MELLTVGELQPLLRVPSRKRIYELVAEGKIPGVVRIGRLLRFNAATIRAWLSGQPMAASKPTALARAEAA